MSEKAELGLEQVGAAEESESRQDLYQSIVQEALERYTYFDDWREETDPRRAIYDFIIETFIEDLCPILLIVADQEVKLRNVLTHDLVVDIPKELSRTITSKDDWDDLVLQTGEAVWEVRSSGSPVFNSTIGRVIKSIYVEILEKRAKIRALK